MDFGGTVRIRSTGGPIFQGCMRLTLVRLLELFDSFSLKLTRICTFGRFIFNRLIYSKIFRDKDRGIEESTCACDPFCLANE